MTAYDEMRSELKELLKLVRVDQEYCSAVMSGSVEVTAALEAEHNARAVRISELSARYGLS